MNVLRSIVTLGMLVSLATFGTAPTRADFSSDFKQALEVYTTHRYGEAQVLFGRLAAAAPTARSKAVCQTYAALSLSRQSQYEAAIDLAKQIVQKPLAIDCQMQIMLEHRQHQALVEAFKDEDIAAWPDCCIHHGFHRRGTAYRLTGNAQAAAKDLEKAIENSVTADQFQVIALDELGGVYQTLKDDQKSLDAYRKVQSFSRFRDFYPFLDATLGIVNILLRQGRLDEALAELRKLDVDRATGNWKFLMLQAYGDIALAQGTQADALGYYRKAIEVKDAARSYLDRLKKRMSSLGTSAAPN